MAPPDGTQGYEASSTPRNWAVDRGTPARVPICAGWKLGPSRRTGGAATGGVVWRAGSGTHISTARRDDGRLQDLDERKSGGPGAGGAARQQRRGVLRDQRLRGAPGLLERPRQRALRLPPRRPLLPPARVDEDDALLRQIGRASCRERAY